MYRPTTRVLSVLEMLQSQERVTGAEIAERLDVHIRTVQCYITILEDLGIPMDAQPQIAPEIAVLEAVDAGVLRCSTDDLPFMARILAKLDCAFVVHHPMELKEAIRQHAQSLMANAA